LKRLLKTVQQHLVVVGNIDLVKGNMAVDKALLVGIVQRRGQGIENIGGGFHVDDAIGPA